MAPKTKNSYGSQEPGDDIQRLALQIEALEVGPGSVGGARPAAMNNARPNQRNSNALPTVTLTQLVIADQPPAPPRPKVRTLEEQMLRDPDAALRLSQPRVRLPKQEAPPTPEVRRKRTIISLPLIAPTQSASRAPSSTRDSFRVRIVPAEQMSTMWDDDVDDAGLFAWQGTLIVRSSGPDAYTYAREAVKDFKIQFRGHGQPLVHAARSSSLATQAGGARSWCADYKGHRARASDGRLPRLDVSHGIVVENPSEPVPAQDSAGGNTLTWFIRFWVPVPVTLIARAEHKSFVCQARVKIQHGEESSEETWVSAEDIVVGIERLKLKQLPVKPRALNG